jgi:hypothetical protein
MNHLVGTARDFSYKANTILNVLGKFISCMATHSVGRFTWYTWQVPYAYWRVDFLSLAGALCEENRLFGLTRTWRTYPPFSPVGNLVPINMADTLRQ